MEFLLIILALWVIIGVGPVILAVIGCLIFKFIWWILKILIFEPISWFLGLFGIDYEIGDPTENFTREHMGKSWLKSNRRLARDPFGSNFMYRVYFDDGEGEYYADVEAGSSRSAEYVVEEEYPGCTILKSEILYKVS